MKFIVTLWCLIRYSIKVNENLEKPSEYSGTQGIVFCITAAGQGKRFPKSIWGEKPFIEVNNRSLLEYSVKSLPLTKQDFLIIALGSSQNCERAKELVEELRIPCKYVIVEVLKQTRGQAETAWIAIQGINEMKNLVIHNCDTAFNLTSKQVFENSSNSLLLFKRDEPRWSYAELDLNGNVIRTAEKIQISDNASVGTYQFASIELFREVFMQSRHLQGEHYIAPMYNLLLDAGHIVRGIMADDVFPLGTPEDIVQQRSNLEKLWRPNF